MRPSSFSSSARPSPNPSSHRPTGSTPDRPRPHEPSSAIRTPLRRSLPATSPTPDLLGEPRRYSSCPMHPSHRPRALALDPAAREPSASRGHPRHRVGFGRGDRAPSRPHARHAHALWATATAGPGRHVVAPSCHSRPPAHAAPRHCGLGPEPRPIAGFRFSFLFDLVKFL
jgi:hypothetical protein